MALFQGVNPQSLEGSRMALLQRLQAQMQGQQQNRQKMRSFGPGAYGQQQPGGGMGNGGAAIGRPLGTGQMRGSFGRTGVTQGDNVAAAIMSRLGAINPRALRGEFSGSPGEGIDAMSHQGVLQPGGMNIPAPSPGGGPTNAPGMGNATTAPGGAPAQQGGTPPGYSGAFTGDQVGPAGPSAAPQPGMISAGSQLGTSPADPSQIGIANTPAGQFQQQQLIPLGDGRFFDPVTGAIRGGSNAGGAYGVRFGH